ncbi:MAG: hypothetical protein BWK76_25410 [Desulfobulbaceae bacterium A2]|nr:MAG: hypothetical protein BWK76_25410 [Desulfobulbaceae bacterium A2]
MRCPKCGFISFDHLATCKGCGRNVTTTSGALLGTCSDVDAPVFLRLNLPEIEEDVSVAQGTGMSQDLSRSPSGGGEESFEFRLDGEEETTVLDLGGDEPLARGAAGAVPQEREIELILDGGTATTPAEIKEKEKKSESPTAVSPAADMRPVRSFADIDISDLAPPPPPSVSGKSFHAAQRVQANAKPQPPPPPAKPAVRAAPAATGRLEQLELGELASDFAEPALQRKQYHPPVRTGTALDDFVLDRARLGLKTPATGTPLDDFSIDPARLGLGSAAPAGEKRG